VSIVIQLLEDAPVDRNQVVPYDQSCLQRHDLCSFAPRMVIYLGKTVSFGWIHIQDFLNQVLELLTDEVRQLILP
jgi:hypothetical protein